jgi:hypothetical protein
MAKTIFELGGKWFFWNETWTESHGPFDTKEEAIEKFKLYLINELGYKLSIEEEDEINRGYN